MYDKGKALHLGDAVDELVRHHPPIRPIVLNAILQLLRQVINDGTDYNPSNDSLQDYVVEALLSKRVKIQQGKSEKVANNPILAAFVKILKVMIECGI